MLACLLAWYWQRNFPCEFTENCFVIFDQSSSIILLMLYCQLYCILWIPCGYPLDGSVEDFWQNQGGLQKIFLLVRFFNRISCNKHLKVKILHFFTRFLFHPLGLECSRIRKIALFLTSQRLKKYKNLHP